ncbi:hypothetical protein QQS21_004765 [Conoideocrella luteorostrata]|uniref:Uncharacterized protein n=1 Tax=Conoideocrella luteorostrata TaxID=1105319 RepID=A0AAJ0CQQ7_9HYPO|nr:hypothetical protein QQS21_004765 [Conoideocrella luteorostrata]
MFGRASFVYFLSFLALLGPALTAHLYRLDFRSPDEIYRAGGMLSWNPSGKGSVIDHVNKKLGDKDPWVSTTNDKKVIQRGATSPSSVNIYYIDPSSLDIVDTVKEFRKAKVDHPHPGEKEFAVKGYIPWKNIVKWETYVRGTKTATTTREEYEKSQKGGSSPKKSAKRYSIRSFVA